MKDIRLKENLVIEEFKNVILLDKDGTGYAVPVIYGSPEKLMSAITVNHLTEEIGKFEPIDRIRLPMIGLNTIEIGQSFIKMTGIVWTLYRADLNQIIEQFHNTVELNDKITISSVAVNQSEIYPAGGVKGLNVCCGEFFVEFRE